MRDRREVDPDGRGHEKELEKIEGGETITRMYCVKKLFQ